jgi:hypothetical protein
LDYVSTQATIALALNAWHNYAIASGKSSMHRASSPSNFSSHLQIARQIVAGAIDSDNIADILSSFDQFGDNDASHENLTAARNLLKLHSPIVSDMHYDEMAQTALPTRFSMTVDVSSTSCVAVFNLHEKIQSIRQDISLALDTDNLWGCSISNQVRNRLQIAKDLPYLADHLFRSASDHFVSDILNLLDDIPGMMTVGRYGRIWTSSFSEDDEAEVITWISAAGLTQFVNLFIFLPSERCMHHE